MLASEIDLAKLKVEQAENMSMSIRPSSSGLAFIIYEGKDFDGEQREGFLSIEASPKPWSERQSDLFFAHSFLALPFHRVKYYYEAVQGLILPNELYQENFDDLWLNYVDSEESLTAIRQEVPNESKSLLFYIPKALLTFLQRTHVRLELEPYFQPLLLLNKLASRQKGKRKLSLSLRHRALDCWLLDRGDLIYYNSFPIVEQQSASKIEGELMYYLFMLVGRLGLDLEQDELSIYTSNAESESIQTLLKETAQLIEGNLKERISNYKQKTE